ncbi:Rv1733c family protein [Streptomyces sp. NPDC002156]
MEVRRGTRVYGWRWRRNPLRRRSDVVEAWTVLVVAVVLCVGAPLVGALAARWAHDEARATADAQRAERHQVRAVAVAGPVEPSALAGRQHLYRVQVLWTEPGGGARTATAHVPAGTRRGDVIDLWLDAQGQAVAPPPGAAAVQQHAVAVGICAAGATVGVTLLARTAVHRTAVQRRLGEWERAWARTEPEWTRRRA